MIWRNLELCNLYITFYFLGLFQVIGTAMLGFRGSLINERASINFHFSYAVELIITPFYEFFKTEAGKEVFSKARLFLSFYLFDCY